MLGWTLELTGFQKETTPLASAGRGPTRHSSQECTLRSSEPPVPRLLLLLCTFSRHLGNMDHETFAAHCRVGSVGHCVLDALLRVCHKVHTFCTDARYGGIVALSMPSIQLVMHFLL